MVALINFINKKFLLSHILEGDRGFLAKIPEHKRDSIFMIKSNENYIEVFFEDKIETINYRLKDAIKEMPANMGIQIHKSYWINKSYFKEISKKNNKNYITLTNSLEIPIGGTFLALIKENFKKI
jgi:DNA-binding LytR/AlgR family response regulator